MKSILSLNNCLIKQINSSLMEGSISVVFSDKYMCKMENYVANSLNPIFYIHYVDNTYAKKTEMKLTSFFML